jgi:hypothetical protein
MQTVFYFRDATDWQFILALSCHSAEFVVTPARPVRLFVVSRTSKEARAMNSWGVEYMAALAEKDPEKQRKLVYKAIVAIEQRRLTPLEPDSEETESIDRTDKALKTLKRSLSEGRRRGGSSA